jgi:hypothetical protein
LGILRYAVSALNIRLARRQEQVPLQRRSWWLAFAVLVVACQAPPREQSADPQEQDGVARESIATVAPAATARAAAPEIGFRNARLYQEHYARHGRDFGRVSADEYLRLAQALRDTIAGGDILEIRRADGVISRFDRTSGSFIAFNRDLVIRTFFRPNDGEAYFRRQARRRPVR